MLGYGTTTDDYSATLSEILAFASISLFLTFLIGAILRLESEIRAALILISVLSGVLSILSSKREEETRRRMEEMHKYGGSLEVYQKEGIWYVRKRRP
ncbi:hypothetical protein DRN52_01035 [Thermococci archaeon]|nr:MAG: hypothetical protein DRN52_01035 [Thermococci archaeon]